MSSSYFNVFRQPLKRFSTQPMSGFYRDGYCRTGDLDIGHHVVAGIVSDEFLDFTALQGNDLRVVPGMRAGCKWCLCTSRWVDALRAFEAGRLSRDGVPKVDLEATEETALRGVDLHTLSGFAVQRERQRQQLVNGVTNGVNGDHSR